MLEAMAALLVALILSWLLTPWAMRKARAWGALDKPDARKVHEKPVPRIGGLAVFLAFVIPVLLFRQLSPPVLGLLAGGTLIIILGLIDDIKGLPAKVKLLGQVVAATAVVPFGVKVHYITNPLSGDVLYLGFLAIPVTVFWLVAVTNAVNLIDGLDGLAGGVSCIAALTLAAVAWTQWHLHGVPGMGEIILLALTLAAAVLGFLRYNFHPAKVFLGDCGSMFLGFSLAVLSVTGFIKSFTAISVLVPLLVLGLPLLDTFFAIVRRYHNHRPIFQPDKEHLHHQLMNMGLTHRQTVLAIYGVSAVLGTSAVVLNLVSTDQAAVLLVVLSLGVLWLANRTGIVRGRKGAVLPADDSRTRRMDT